MPRGAKPGERRGGRKKNTPNKRTQTLIERAEKLGIDPFEILLHFAEGDWEALGYKSETKLISAGMGQTLYVDTIAVEDRIQAAKEVCQYLYPKRKAIEHTGKDGEDLFESLTQMFKRVADSKEPK